MNSIKKASNSSQNDTVSATLYWAIR